MLGAALLLILPFTPAAPSTAGGVVAAHATAAGGRSTPTVAAPPVQLHVFPNRVAAFNVCNPCRYPPRGGVGQSPLRHVLQIVAEIARYRPQVISLEEICVGEANLVARYLNELRGCSITSRWAARSTERAAASRSARRTATRCCPPRRSPTRRTIITSRRVRSRAVMSS